MYSHFTNLDREKQDRIINAAIKEFAENGYDNSSTNEIVKAAEISKGLLFHYFNSKKDLFLFLYDYCMDMTLKEFFQNIDRNQIDFFQRFRQIQAIKYDLMHKYPEIFAFLEATYFEESTEVKSDLDARNKELMWSITGKMFEGIDRSRFREGVDLEKAIKTMVWTFRGLGEELLLKAKRSGSNQVDYAQAFVEQDAYLEMFRHCFYKS